MNSTKSVEPKDVLMEDLKAEEREIGAEGQVAESDPNESSDLRESYSSAPMNVTTNGVENEETNGIDKDEITASPIQERPGRDIRFRDLPHPPKHERSDSEGPPNEGVS